jgi:hypothetical protein
MSQGKFKAAHLQIFADFHEKFENVLKRKNVVK